MNVEDIETIAVLGAGNMGHGIAEVAALAGYDVRLRDINEELVENGYDQLEWSVGKLEEKDQLTEEEADAALERVTPLVDLEETVSGTDFIIEVVPEKMDIKQDVYGEVEQYAPEDALFATNTSSLSITDLAEVTERPEGFCGMHFFNPPVRMQLVEVISGEHTADETLDTVEALAEEFGKTPVRVRKDSPGFIVNRVLVPLMNEAAWLVEDDVATMGEVDSTTKFDMGLPMGSFELADQVGIDVGYHVLEYMHETLGDAYEPCPLLEAKVEAEELGKKSGTGFYEYDEGDGADIPTDAGSEEIESRLLAVMANEVAKLVGNDVAPAEDIDEAVMLGAGFPQGPAKMADDVGLDSLYETLSDLHDETGAPRYEPADYLDEHAGDGFYEGDESEDGVDFETIRIEHPGDMVGKIVIDRPHRMNTINAQILDELDSAIDTLEDDDDVRAILLVGAGDDAFSAGADVQSMASSADPLDAADLSRKGKEAFGKLEECSMPVVAGIDGYCLGGGMELSMCADLRVAAERAEFGQPELDLGLIPGWGGTQRLQHIVGEGRAKEIILTAERYDADEMESFGFVNRVVANDELEDSAYDLAAELAAGPPIAHEFAKRAMVRGWENTEAGFEIESQAFGHLVGTEDLMEGITAFMGDSDPEFEGK
ncbi:3-hydroxyacyl-CoA dehydrogenase/enoyl-CoA hydratase family protein [Halococcus sp. AFM35]|uniref:3-hydroxyacyl-CoA dehydrogenase/enoyl-CoA hydratase family protein n=1 Tax=Halococcus sp. AFM35 TaxID=3421653 RepID=UPI003EB81F05